MYFSLFVFEFLQIVPSLSRTDALYISTRSGGGQRTYGNACVGDNVYLHTKQKYMYTCSLFLIILIQAYIHIRWAANGSVYLCTLIAIHIHSTPLIHTLLCLVLRPKAGLFYSYSKSTISYSNSQQSSSRILAFSHSKASSFVFVFGNQSTLSELSNKHINAS